VLDGTMRAVASTPQALSASALPAFMHTAVRFRIPQPQGTVDAPKGPRLQATAPQSSDAHAAVRSSRLSCIGFADSERSHTASGAVEPVATDSHVSCRSINPPPHADEQGPQGDSRILNPVPVLSAMLSSAWI
jgi:hypothetical protein